MKNLILLTASLLLSNLALADILVEGNYTDKANPGKKILIENSANKGTKLTIDFEKEGKIIQVETTLTPKGDSGKVSVTSNLFLASDSMKPIGTYTGEGLCVADKKMKTCAYSIVKSLGAQGQKSVINQTIKQIKDGGVVVNGSLSRSWMRYGAPAR